jgi:hypothetical protein
MTKYNSQYQTKITEFSNFYQLMLDQNNRWIQLASILPWDKLANVVASKYNLNKGATGVNPRVIIGALIIKHKMKLTDEDTIESIRENPYQQIFLGFDNYQPVQIFSPSLFVEIRKTLGKSDFQQLNELLIKVTHAPQDSSITHKGELKIDATVADQDIRYPNDLGLLNEARLKTEIIIDLLFDNHRDLFDVKPRTYRRKAAEIYLKEAKKKKKQEKEIRKALRNSLNCVERNLGHINKMLDKTGFKLEYKYLRYLWIIKQLWEQQWDMFINKTHTCKDRIVSISQPHVRPIVRGKQAAMVEFGSKLGLSLFDGYLSADTLSWDAYNESSDLIKQAENYRKILGYYPEIIMADKIYWTNENRKWCSENKVRLTATAKGRPVKKSEYQKRKEKKEFARRNHIEGKIGNAKQAYNLNQIKAKLKNTSESWIGATLFAMNVMNFANIINSTF